MIIRDELEELPQNLPWNVLKRIVTMVVHGYGASTMNLQHPTAAPAPSTVSTLHQRPMRAQGFRQEQQPRHLGPNLRVVNPNNLNTKTPAWPLAPSTARNYGILSGGINRRDPVLYTTTPPACPSKTLQECSCEFGLCLLRLFQTFRLRQARVRPMICGVA